MILPIPNHVLYYVVLNKLIFTFCCRNQTFLVILRTMFGSLLESAKRNHFANPFFTSAQCAGGTSTCNQSSCQPETSSESVVPRTHQLLAASTAETAVEGRHDCYAHHQMSCVSIAACSQIPASFICCGCIPNNIIWLKFSTSCQCIIPRSNTHPE